MGWIIFTAVDLYVGLIVLKSLQPSLPPEKQRRVAIAERFILGGLGLCVVAFAWRLLRRD